MSVQTDRSAVARIQGQIADLQKKDAAEQKKEADATQKANAAAESARKTKSVSIAQSKMRELDRYSKQAADAASKRAAISKQISQKTTELHRAQDRLSKAERADREKELKGYDRKIRDLEKREKALQDNMTQQAMNAIELHAGPDEQYDVFISHAFEDKESFVREFAEMLQARGVKVWYDETSLVWGQRQRQAMDRGIASSKFGIVVLSNFFFSKSWALNELEGLMANDANGSCPLLPIWHNISKNEVLKESPMLAGRTALLTAAHTVDEICDKVEEILKSASGDTPKSA
ncbi:MAG: hypothetical protein CME88_09915 [Hirschia sp.]|nr:hypothetical protein [Hirschia sp.]MBF18683.1 hypothetical protein [Hirschia sp.]|tara:strand:+ start:54 stop:923 length:870 start_codon:yes stop_codon:yes gene_type:complete